MSLELYGTPGCPWTAELRQELEWDGRAFVEYDVEADKAAFARLSALTGGQRTVPVLVEDGKIRQVGFQGRTCMASPPSA
jgi:glutaredoxin 3